MSEAQDPRPGAAPLVATPRARYRGVDHNGCRVFHSVEFCRLTGGPFAASRPLPGFGRLPGGGREPDPAEPLEVDATAARPEKLALSVACPHGSGFGDDRPVVVFIHGGSYLEGSHEDFDLTCLAAAGVVAVGVGYRLGAQGFARFHDDEPDRYRGVDDCLLALEWVQREIEYFGGDPTNVTLAGQSAGAGICLWLTRTDHFRGLFRRVWGLSPAFPRVPFERRKGQLRRILGTPVTRRHFSRRLERRPRAFARGIARFRRRHPLDLVFGPAPFAADRLAEVPVLLSCTRDEMYNEPTLRRADARGLGATAVRLLGRVFGLEVPAKSYLDSIAAVGDGRALSRLAGDAVVRRWVAETGESAPGPVWLAELTGTAAQPAVHCDDLPLIFGPGTGPAGGPEAEGNHVRELLLSFARDGEPGWPAYRRSTGRVTARIDRDSGARTQVTDPLRAVRLAFQRPRWR